MTSRAEVLGRIRGALADAPAAPPVPRDYRAATTEGVDVVELFRERVADYRATVRPVSPDAVAAAVTEALREHGDRRVVVPTGVARSWLDVGGLAIVRDEPPLTHLELDAIDAVVTACALGIAETGTIVLDAGPDQGRRVLSLLPDHHVCVIRANQIVGTVPEAIARLDPRRPLTWISGPSATSDIELQRVEGVHGPRTLDVLLIAG